MRHIGPYTYYHGPRSYIVEGPEVYGLEFQGAPENIVQALNEAYRAGHGKGYKEGVDEGKKKADEEWKSQL